MAAAKPISLWDFSATEPDHVAPLEPSETVDVAIVGGGFTGLSTALHAAEAGLLAHVLEAERIGFGGSGRNVGLVNAAAWVPPGVVRRLLGETYGPRFLDVFGAAPEYVFALIEKHQIRCEARREGTIHAAHAASGLRDLQARHAAWQALGAPVDLLSRDEMQQFTGTAAFPGGLHDHRAGTVNPMGYCRGLARAAVGAGARISTGVRATRLAQGGGLWRVETTAGTLTARAVVLGTNAYTDDLWPGLDRVCTHLEYFQVASQPLGEAAAHILPGGQGLWDTGKIMFNLRRDAEGRLLIGSMGRIFGSAQAGLTRRWAQRKLSRLYPELGPVRLEEAWFGKIAMTQDHLPMILRLAEGVYTPIGYNGRGITTGTVFGRAMADLLTGAEDSSLPLPVTRLGKARGNRVAEHFYRAAFAAHQAFKAL